MSKTVKHLSLQYFLHVSKVSGRLRMWEFLSDYKCSRTLTRGKLTEVGIYLVINFWEKRKIRNINNQENLLRHVVSNILQPFL